MLYDGSYDILEAQKTQQPPGVYVGGLDIVGYHNRLHHNSGVLTPSRRRIFLFPVSMFFRKYSCLVPAFNKHIDMLHTGGLIQLWSKVYQTIPLPQKEKHVEPKRLAFEQVGGIYIIAAYLYAFCLFVFLVELLSLKVRCLRTMFQYLWICLPKSVVVSAESLISTLLEISINQNFELCWR